MGGETRKTDETPEARKAGKITKEPTNAASPTNMASAKGISSSRTSRLLRSRSGTDSPRSLDSVRTRQVFSPLRPPRNVQSPCLDSGDEGSLRLERGTYQHMFQDIVSIKTMLLKLKRVLQEAETLNPFDNSLKNGLFYNLNEEGVTDTTTIPGSVKDNVSDELADLRRQVVFLQGQVEDKDRTIQLLQLQMTKHQGLNGVDSQLRTPLGQSETKETCNATTQTEKIRPVSAGPGMLQSLPQDGGMGPLVSWSDFNNHHSPSITEFNQNKSRKSADRSSRMLRSPKEHTSNRKTELTSDISSNKTSSKDTPTSKSVDLDEIIQQCSTKIESSPIKSSIPAPRRLATPSLIPRSARADSATGRLPGPDLGITFGSYSPGSPNFGNSISSTPKIN